VRGRERQHRIGRIAAARTTRPARRLSRDESLRKIIGVLISHAMVVVSGTKMSQELGASRHSVWRMVEELRRYGVAIEGHPTTGYVLKAVPDLPLPEQLEPQLKGTIFSGKLHHRFRSASTNEDALQAAAAGAPEGSVFLAEEQLAGRGRGGHAWHSPRSYGIYCSIVLRPSLSPAEILPLSLAAGLAAQSAVEQVTGLACDLRWPNDLLVNGKKFGGILAEMNAEPTRIRYLVVGIGFNVNQTEFPPDLRESATSLLLARAEMSKDASPLPRLGLLAALLKSFDREYRNLRSAEIIARFAERSSCVRGKRVRVGEDGSGAYEGTTAGLDERGFLRVQTDSGVCTVLSGGVREI